MPGGGTAAELVAGGIEGGKPVAAPGATAVALGVGHPGQEGVGLVQEEALQALQEGIQEVALGEEGAYPLAWESSRDEGASPWEEVASSYLENMHR